MKQKTKQKRAPTNYLANYIDNLLSANSTAKNTEDGGAKRLSEFGVEARLTTDLQHFLLLLGGQALEFVFIDGLEFTKLGGGGG